MICKLLEEKSCKAKCIKVYDLYTFGTERLKSKVNDLYTPCLQGVCGVCRVTSCVSLIIKVSHDKCSHPLGGAS